MPNVENSHLDRDRLCGNSEEGEQLQTMIVVLRAILIALVIAALFPVVAVLLTALGIVFMFLVFR